MSMQHVCVCFSRGEREEKNRLFEYSLRLYKMFEWKPNVVRCVNVQATTAQSLRNVLFTCTLFLSRSISVACPCLPHAVVDADSDFVFVIFFSSFFSVVVVSIRFPSNLFRSFSTYSFYLFDGIFSSSSSTYSSLQHCVFNGANVYNHCAYGPTRYNLRENTTRICFLYTLLYIQ